MKEDKLKKIIDNTIDKLLDDPDELFDIDKIRKKYNESLKEIIKLKTKNISYEKMKNDIIFYLKNENLNKMLWGKEILRIINKSEGKDGK